MILVFGEPAEIDVEVFGFEGAAQDEVCDRDAVVQGSKVSNLCRGQTAADYGEGGGLGGMGFSFGSSGFDRI